MLGAAAGLAGVVDDDFIDLRGQCLKHI